MRIPPYWAKAVHTGKDKKGETRSFLAWGWSLDNLATAKKDATEKAKRVFDRLTTGTSPSQYGYLDQPLREEIVETVSREGKEIALITRNRYGALVLNTDSVCFADIDFPPLRTTGLMDGILLAFSRKRKSQRMQAVREKTIQSVRDWAKQNPDHSFRLYRTFAGLRLLFTDRLYDPTSPETDKFLAGLGSDPLYRKLTEKQECFRARLTPKPWRSNCVKPPNRYPREDASAEKRYREWEQEYQNKTRKFATCELIDSIGKGMPEKIIHTVVEIHDRYVFNNKGATLA
ncbi:MAG: hypothetical protein FP816_09780 [Desulfobacteraceae bacterium]|nr:hypothetical protein [Desulfobacteraceae bacterium]MBU4001409.1 hypothetical protein [Pseudomonadota bacterium]MBU4054181.1 hypothetical protein [Pseudomonadota bacterium]